MVDPKLSECPACGADNACGAVKGMEKEDAASAEKCWCMSLPLVKDADQRPSDGQPLRCFCQSCLAARASW